MAVNRDQIALAHGSGAGVRPRALGSGAKMLEVRPMTPTKPAFPAPDHDHDRCTADAISHAEQVCRERAQKFTPIRRQVLQALLSSHRPLGAYEVIDELAKSMPRPAPITVYRALDFLMANGLVHRIESRNAYLACAHDHDAAAVVAFLICERCGSVGEIPGSPRGAEPLHRGARLGLCAKTFRRRNHRHLRALPEGRLEQATRRQAGPKGRNAVKSK